MQKKFSTILQSFAVFPILTANLVLAPFTGAGTGLPTVAAIFPDQNGTLTSEVADNKQPDAAVEADLELKAAKIDAYFAKYNLPYAGKGMKLVTAAYENDIPLYTLAALSFVESTAGKNACGNNGFGWKSCKGSDFKSVDEAIDTVAAAIGGNNDNTRHYYEGKSQEQVWETYNGRANPSYVKNMKWVMDQFDKQDVPDSLATVSKTNA